MSILERLMPGLATAGLPDAWRLVSYHGYKVCHVEGEDLIRHLRDGRYEERSVSTVASWHGPGCVGLDIGANIGFFSLGVLARKAGGTILAFEPNPETFARLSLTLELNRLRDAVHAYPLALAESAGVLPFARHDARSSSGDGLVDTGRAGPAERILVPTATLDAIVEGLDLERIDWIKIDVEGAELRVFEGASETLKRHAPWLLFEAHPVNLASHDLEPEAVYEAVRSAGYGIAPLDDPGRELTAEGFRAKVEARDENFIGRPKGRSS